MGTFVAARNVILLSAHCALERYVIAFAGHILSHFLLFAVVTLAYIEAIIYKKEPIRFKMSL